MQWAVGIYRTEEQNLGKICLLGEGEVGKKYLFSFIFFNSKSFPSGAYVRGVVA